MLRKPETVGICSALVLIGVGFRRSAAVATVGIGLLAVPFVGTTLRT